MRMEFIPLKKGGVVEHELFDAIKPKEGEPAERGIGHREYMPFRQALQWVKERQPAPPGSPKAFFARDLRLAIIESIHKEKKELYRKLKRVNFYTAISSSLDHHHGIDGFVEVIIEQGTGDRSILVTLDVTIQDKDEWKADILVKMPADNLDPRIDKEGYTQKVSKVAQAVISRLENSALEQVVVE